MEVIDFYIWNRYDATYTFYFWSFDGIDDICFLHHPTSTFNNDLNIYIWFSDPGLLQEGQGGSESQLTHGRLAIPDGLEAGEFGP